MRWLPLLFLLSCSRATASPTDLTFSGECDGSAVVVHDDALFIGVDEGTTLLVYPLPEGRPLQAQPHSRIDLAPLLERVLDTSLNEKKGTPRELDIEATARAGDQLWWLGGHGRSKSGKTRPNRRMLFATSTSPATGMQVVGPPQDLMPAILRLPNLGPQVAEAESRDLPPKEGGLSIEGLAAAPSGDELMIGLRSPLTPDNRAWVLRRTSDGELQEHAQLDLGGLGIRSLTWSKHVGSYLIAAGSTGSGGPFALYRWDGQGAPERIDLDLGTLRPEGLTDLPAGLLLVSDDSGVKRDGFDCKDRRAADPTDPLVHFRARILSPSELRR